MSEVLLRCGKTGAWYGIPIVSLDQVNSMGDSPLHTVCSWGELESVERLVKAGAHVNARGDRGCTPLFNAVIGGNAAVVTYLRRNGADVSIRSSDGQSILDYAKAISASREVLAALR